MSKTIFDLIGYEEGFKERPYYCSMGYPTVGFGFKIGPKDAPLKFYQFSITKEIGTVWLASILNILINSMKGYSQIDKAIQVCNEAQSAVLISMAYQMGADGLSNFKNTLNLIINKDFNGASKNMLDSLWAKQTPNRAARHAEQLRTGQWCNLY